eukprot:Sspe_Gene.7217::Locus_2443_Transcript_1_1_Confidence_1.000_Length_1752::g.7217::m.7217
MSTEHTLDVDRCFAAPVLLLSVCLLHCQSLGMTPCLHKSPEVLQGHHSVVKLLLAGQCCLDLHSTVPLQLSDMHCCHPATPRGLDADGSCLLLEVPHCVQPLALLPPYVLYDQRRPIRSVEGTEAGGCLAGLPGPFCALDGHCCLPSPCLVRFDLAQSCAAGHSLHLPEERDYDITRVLLCLVLFASCPRVGQGSLLSAVELHAGHRPPHEPLDAPRRPLLHLPAVFLALCGLSNLTPQLFHIHALRVPAVGSLDGHCGTVLNATNVLPLVVDLPLQDAQRSPHAHHFRHLSPHEGLHKRDLRLELSLCLLGMGCRLSAEHPLPSHHFAGQLLPPPALKAQSSLSLDGMVLTQHLYVLRSQDPPPELLEGQRCVFPPLSLPPAVVEVLGVSTPPPRPPPRSLYYRSCEVHRRPLSLHGSEERAVDVPTPHRLYHQRRLFLPHRQHLLSVFL